MNQALRSRLRGTYRYLVETGPAVNVEPLTIQHQGSFKVVDPVEVMKQPWSSLIGEEPILSTLFNCTQEQLY